MLIMNNKVILKKTSINENSQRRLYKYLLEESNNTLRKDIANTISISIINSLDFSDNYVAHKSMRQRAKDIVPQIKKEYFIIK